MNPNTARNLLSLFPGGGGNELLRTKQPNQLSRTSLDVKAVSEGAGVSVKTTLLTLWASASNLDPARRADFTEKWRLACRELGVPELVSFDNAF
jgi:hypothetical protein